ncbi:MAG TPA: glycosyltransferase family 4 protein [Bacteroidales bacterium]|mgnify:FL=1|nr:glycosyltransferase family 4 protein [Bacteroidales bacterium]
MKILQLCHKPPLPPKDGGCIAMNNITQGLLQQNHQVKVVAISTPKHPVNSKDLDADYYKKTKFETVFINTGTNLFKIFKTMLFNRSYYISRFYSKELEKKLVEIFSKETFDIVQLESIFVTPYIPIIKRHSKAKIILRTHNIEHKIWQRRTAQQSSIFKKLIFTSLTKKLKKVELSTFNHIHGYMPISSHDFEYFHSKFPNIPATTIPFGVDLQNYKPEDYIPSDNPSLFHLGSLDWQPNLEGIQWFLDEIWYEIVEHFPNLTFTIAGRHIPQSIADKGYPNVNVVGEIENVNEFMLSHDIMIVPILAGSGIRVKIIEGMALGKTIITTPIGAEGLEIEHGKNIFIASNAEEFIAALQQCLNTPDICKIIGENARNFVMLKHNNEVITKKIESFYEAVADTNKPSHD